jgi:hypothetical protein
MNSKDKVARKKTPIEYVNNVIIQETSEPVGE